MSNIDKIKAEIERLKKEATEMALSMKNEFGLYYVGRADLCDKFLSFIATLDEQPSEDLEVVNDLTEGPIKAVRLPDGRYVTEKLAREAGDLEKED